MSNKSCSYAVLSDIHGNFQALQAVVKDARAIAKRETLRLRLICLGDVVDYGPQPNECMDWVCKQSEIIAVQGNHDAAASDPFYCSPRRRGVASIWWPITLWTRRELEEPYRTMLGSWRPSLHANSGLDRFILYHSSLIGGDVVYVDNAAQARAEMKEIEHINNRERWDIHYGLLGHSHIQGYFYEKAAGAPQFFLACAGDRYPADCPQPPRLAGDHRYNSSNRPGKETTERDWTPVPAMVGASSVWQRLLPSWQKALFNPGSVGQPRPHAALIDQEAYSDWRAAYMLLRIDERGIVHFQFRRVEYDVELTKHLLQERVRWGQDGDSGRTVLKDVLDPSVNPDQKDVRDLLPTIGGELDTLVRDRLIPNLGKK